MVQGDLWPTASNADPFFDFDDAEELLSFLDMDWTKPEYSTSEIDRAGLVLIDPRASAEECEKALNIIDNFRASHNFPLNTMQVWLRRNAKRIDKASIIVQRIKRLSSIRIKLERLRVPLNLRLSEMQDIGGCRAIVKNTKNIDILVARYK
jgi:hypothetical protein